MQILIMGPPGAGKGTQAVNIAREYKIPHISTGDMFRAAIKAGSHYGKLAQSCMEKGELVSDDITIGIVKDRLAEADCKAGFILDGFPRTVAQADALAEILAELNTSLTTALNVTVPNSDLIERMAGRRICKQCGESFHLKFKPPRAADKCDECGGDLFQRPDDNEETAANRLAVYTENTQPLIDYYKAKGLYTEIDGRQNISKVFSDIVGELERAAASE